MKTDICYLEYPGTRDDSENRRWVVVDKKHFWSRWKIRKDEEGRRITFPSRESAVRNGITRIRTLDLGTVECFDNMKLYYTEYMDPEDKKWRIRDWADRENLIPKFYKTKEEAKKNLIWRR